MAGPTSARPPAWGQAGTLAHCSMVEGTREPRKGQHPQPGPAPGWPCRHRDGAGSKPRLCSAGRQLPCRHVVPAEVLPSPSLTPTPRHVPGRIYCFRSFINAKSVCDGWAGSSSQDVLRSSFSNCPQEQQKNAIAIRTRVRHVEQGLARGVLGRALCQPCTAGLAQRVPRCRADRPTLVLLGTAPQHTHTPRLLQPSEMCAPQ